MSNGTFFNIFWFLFQTHHQGMTDPLQNSCFMCLHGYIDLFLFFYLSLWLSVCSHCSHLSLLGDYRHPLVGFDSVHMIPCYSLTILALLAHIIFSKIILCKHHILLVSISPPLHSSAHLYYYLYKFEIVYLFVCRQNRR